MLFWQTIVVSHLKNGCLFGSNSKLIHSQAHGCADCAGCTGAKFFGGPGVLSTRAPNVSGPRSLESRGLCSTRGPLYPAIHNTSSRQRQQGHILGRPINPMWTFLLEKKIDFLAINRTQDLKHMVQTTSQATVWVIDAGLFPKYNILFNGYNKKYMSNFLRWGPN